jgi:hypothetical protein
LSAELANINVALQTRRDAPIGERISGLDTIRENTDLGTKFRKASIINRAIEAYLNKGEIEDILKDSSAALTSILK